jgi:hypothetical protein
VKYHKNNGEKPRPRPAYYTHKTNPVCQFKSVDVEHDLRSSKIPDRVFSVCDWGVNECDLETRFKEGMDVTCHG